MDTPSLKATLNPPIYLISLLPVLAVAAMSGGEGIRWVPLAGAGAGVLLLQHGVNVLNDAMDWVRGADVEKQASWVRYHGGSLERVRCHGWWSVVGGLTVGLIAVAGAGVPEVLLVALPLVALGLGYNLGSRPLAYGPWGEWVTGICYGPGVAGCLSYVARGKFSPEGGWLSLAFAALAVAILLNHQPPQILTDSLAGKSSFAVRHGAKRTYRVAALLFVGFFVALGAAWRGRLP